MEMGNLLECASEQVPEGFSRVPNKVFKFSISSWLNLSYSRDLPSIGCIEDKCACPLSLYCPSL